ncbi:MAG TPA: TaqI-like C-terminal specificity domain-containing protein, partial [bacterium]|nr:TaqI-like C-terminal specificity domain-containing protein [bacterium]
FLKEIEGWRVELAKNIALRNTELSTDDLNRAVQLIIDRIVFLRMAEDRGLEPYEQLLKLCSGADVYRKFAQKICRVADDKYNSGLFHFQKEPSVHEQPDRITPNLIIDDKVFKPILQKLYFEHGSPYQFNVLPVEMLGTVYERFLGKVIRLTKGHQAKVEEKPEVRKAGGVYYTPSYIVDYIVKNTVGKQIEGKSPAQLSGKGKGDHIFRVLDMACGSGSFLLGAYQYLLDHFLKWYLTNKPEKHPNAIRKATRSENARETTTPPHVSPDWCLTIQEKKRILTTHIFGVDIDPQAVEVSKLSLLLKVLEGESDESVGDTMRLWQERALPNLADNIKCGNSLIAPDYFSGTLIPDPDEIKRVNPFDWKREFANAMSEGGFDCVIGNPPYVRQEILGELKTYLKEHYQVYHGIADLYSYFIERGVSLLCAGGIFSFIVANKWMRANYGEPLRRWLKTKCVEEIIDFGDLPVFKNATTYPCIIRINNAEISAKPPSTIPCARIRTLDFRDLTEHVQTCLFPVEISHLQDSGWTLADSTKQNLLAKIRAAGVPLGEYVKGKIYYGIKTGLNEAFVIDRETRERLIAKDPKSAENIKPFLAGRDIKRYQPPTSEKYLICIPRGWTRQRSEDTRNAWAWFEKNYPAIAHHLTPFAAKGEKRCDKGEYWWELRACDYYEEFEKPKIIFPDMATRGQFTFDADGRFFSVNTTYFFTSSDVALLATLNSRLMAFYYAENYAAYRGGYLRFFEQYLIELPIALSVVTSLPREKLSDLALRMLIFHRHFAAASSESERIVLQRQIDATDREIDQLVYELYGLTEEEIR